MEAILKQLPQQLVNGITLGSVYALSPVIAALGGEEAVAETFRAIQDMGRWWP